jgi:hypothetical protein
VPGVDHQARAARATVHRLHDLHAVSDRRNRSERAEFHGHPDARVGKSFGAALNQLRGRRRQRRCEHGEHPFCTHDRGRVCELLGMGHRGWFIIADDEGEHLVAADTGSRVGAGGGGIDPIGIDADCGEARCACRRNQVGRRALPSIVGGECKLHAHAITVPEFNRDKCPLAL